MLELNYLKIKSMKLKNNQDKNHQRHHSLRGVIIQGLLLLGLWLHLSGHYDLFHITIGIVSVGLVMFINAPLKNFKFFHDDYSPWSSLKIKGLISYFTWLLGEIITSGFQVAYLVLHPKMPINPHLIKFQVKMPNLAAKIILGNSITLTPGTVTVELSEDEFLVHLLTPQSAKNLINGKMAIKVARIFDRSASEVIRDVTIFQINEVS